MAADNCPDCGALLPEGQPKGLCSRCALKGALELETQEVSSCPRSFGDYELLEEIARGGMGVVYKARQKSLNRLVAVKFLLLGPRADPDFIKRFRIEASAAAALQHPNIVAIHEVGVHEGEHFLVMDYVDGPNLAKLVREQPLPSKRAAGYLKTIAEAIHYAHEELEAAEAMQRDALAMLKRAYGDTHYAVAVSLNSLTQVQMKRGDLAGAESSQHEAQAVLKKAVGEVHPDVAASLVNLSAIRKQRGDTNGAAALRRESLEMQRILSTNTTPDEVAGSPPKGSPRPGDESQKMTRLSQDRASAGAGASSATPHTGPSNGPVKIADAVARSRKLLQNRLQGMGDAGVLDTTTLDLAVMLIDWAKAEGTNASKAAEHVRESEQLIHDYEAAARKRLSHDPARLEPALYNVAEYRSDYGQWAEAEAIHREIVAGRKARLPSGDDDVFSAVCNLASLLAESAWADHTNFLVSAAGSAPVNRAGEAERLLREALAVRLNGPLATQWRTADAQNRLGFALVAIAVSDSSLSTEGRSQRFAEAEKLMLDSHDRLLPSITGTRKHQRESRTRLVRLYEAWGKEETAAVWKRKGE